MTIDALAESDLSDPLTAALPSVAHPVWGYSVRLDRRGWLFMVSDTAGIDPTETYGLSARTVNEVRRRLVRTGVVAGPGLTDRLNELARESGPAGEPSPLDQWTAAEDRRRSEAADRKAAVLAVRAEKDSQHAAGQAPAPRCRHTGSDQAGPLPAGFQQFDTRAPLTTPRPPAVLDGRPGIPALERFAVASTEDLQTRHRLTELRREPHPDEVPLDTDPRDRSILASGSRGARPVAQHEEWSGTAVGRKNVVDLIVIQLLGGPHLKLKLTDARS